MSESISGKTLHGPIRGKSETSSALHLNQPQSLLFFTVRSVGTSLYGTGTLTWGAQFGASRSTFAARIFLSINSQPPCMVAEHACFMSLSRHGFFCVSPNVGFLFSQTPGNYQRWLFCSLVVTLTTSLPETTLVQAPPSPMWADPVVLLPCLPLRHSCLATPPSNTLSLISGFLGPHTSVLLPHQFLLPN